MSLLTVQQLTKKYGDKTVVDSVNFQLEAHTATALIGPNGAGKTTTMSMITGLLNPTSGSVHLAGEKDIRRSIGFLPQYPQFYSWLSALEYVEMVAKLSHVPAREVSKQSVKVLEYVGLGKHMKRLTGTFSGGMKQRLGIAQAIVHQPKLLLLDEPVSALDPIGRLEVMDILKELQNETTILYSTHILHDAEKMTDQVLFLKDGKLVEQGALQHIQNRYADSKYIVQFTTEQGAIAFSEQLKVRKNNTTCQGNEVTVALDEHIPNMTVLMSILVEQRAEVVKVERVTASLDHIFIKVAGSSDSI